MNFRFPLFPPRRHFRIPGVAILLACVFLVACQTTETVPEHFNQSTIDAKALLDALVSRQKRTTSLRSIIGASATHSGKSHSLRQVLAIGPDRSLRIDTLSPLGQTLGVFIHNDDGDLLYDPGHSRIYRDAEVQNVMRRVIGSGFDLSELTDAFLGNIPGIETHSVRQARLEEGKEFYFLKTQDPFGLARYEVRLDAYTLLPASWAKYYDGALAFKVYWEDYEPLGGIDFARKVTVENDREGEQLTIRYKNPQLNPVLKEDVFKLPLPEAS